MTVNNYIESLKSLPISVANADIEKLCGIQYFFEGDGMKYLSVLPDRNMSNVKCEYGDWQTNMDLAIAVCRFLKKNGVAPQIIIEPTCGKGNFILAALQVFDTIEDIYGIEIYKPYIDELKIQILQYYIHNPNRKKVRIHLYHQNVFDFDLLSIKKSLRNRSVLVLGNPPWVTNSKLGLIDSDNLPKKSNSKKINGLDAITGKGNFDIAEYICANMIDLLSGEHAYIAFLIKNSVAKNIVYEQRRYKYPISEISQYNIDAKKEFGVSVAASLLFLRLGVPCVRCCNVKDFYTKEDLQKYGWIDDCFVADIDSYYQYSHIDGISSLKWRSGLKHDCNKVMELTRDGDKYINGLGEVVNIEEDVIYPLLKSSDIKVRCISSVRKYVVVTQHSTSDDTDCIKLNYPKTYRYLLEHAKYLDNRRSRIYEGRPRFSIFGIGKYSFKPYKLVVSGLYKCPNFSIVCPINNRPVMLDDTCYMLGFDNYDDVVIAQHVFNSKPVQTFISSLIFLDAKRVLNKELLMRINLMEALNYLIDNGSIGYQDGEKFKILLMKNTVPSQFSLFE